MIDSKQIRQVDDILKAIYWTKNLVGSKKVKMHKI